MVLRIWENSDGYEFGDDPIGLPVQIFRIMQETDYKQSIKKSCQDVTNMFQQPFRRMDVFL